MFINSYSGLHFEVSIRGKEDFGGKHDEIHGKGYILADSAQDIILDINCFKPKDFNEKVPALLIELYVDGVLRNIVQPRTGRGMAENQFAESTIDRGVVLTEAGRPLLKKFRFVDLDLDDSVLKCRLVEEAGAIEVRIIQAGLTFNEEDDISFELPVIFNDRCTMSMLSGELNNTVGVRFDDGNESFQDTKMEVRLQSSIGFLIARQNEMLGETLAIFSFQYASDAILHHLGCIPVDHPRYMEELASDRLEVRTRYEEESSSILVRKAVCDSDYTLRATIGDMDLMGGKKSDFSGPKNGTCIVLPIKRKFAAEAYGSPKKRSKSIQVTPQKKLSSLQTPITPPLTPKVENMITYKTVQSEEELSVGYVLFLSGKDGIGRSGKRCNVLQSF